MTVRQPTASDFKLLYSQFSALTDEQVEIWFTQASRRFPLVVLDPTWDLVAYAYAAHSLTLNNPAASAAQAAQNGEATGSRASEKTSDLSLSWKDNYDMSGVSSSLLEFANTTYGRTLISLLTGYGLRQPRVILSGASVAANTAAARSGGGLWWM